MPDANITKRALATSMKTLMCQTPFAKISVGDICEQCGMNRKSFYYHFRDKYDLVNWIYYTEFVEAMQQKHYDESWEFLRDMCVYFYENRRFYVNALKVEGQDSFREYFGQVFRPIILNAAEEAFVASEYQEFYAVFFADAFLVAIERWLREDSMPPEIFVDLIRAGVEGSAWRVVRRMEGHTERHEPPEG